jgi:hypothetical protein
MSSSRKPPRDPGAPKRNMSAYLLYQNAMRDTFKQQVRRKKLSTSSPMGGGGASISYLIIVFSSHEFRTPE